MKNAPQTVWVVIDVIRGIVLGMLVCYAIYKILFADIIGPVFRYAGY